MTQGTQFNHSEHPEVYVLTNWMFFHGVPPAITDPDNTFVEVLYHAHPKAERAHRLLAKNVAWSQVDKFWICRAGVRSPFDVPTNVKDKEFVHFAKLTFSGVSPKTHPSLHVFMLDAEDEQQDTTFAQFVNKSLESIAKSLGLPKQHCGGMVSDLVFPEGCSVAQATEPSADTLISLRQAQFRAQRKHAHYFKDVSHLDEIDVYRVLDLFNVTDQAIGHAAKKLLCTGTRGQKDFRKDLTEAIDTLQRRVAMLDEDEQADQGE